jgi:hypothetical protein
MLDLRVYSQLGEIRWDPKGHNELKLVVQQTLHSGMELGDIEEEGV